MHLTAAALVAEGRLTIDKIAAQVGVSEKTIDRWMKLPTFKAEVERVIAAAEKKIMAAGIGSKAQRLRASHRRWELMMRVIDERAADPAMASVPGGTTGALVRQLKSVGYGENNKVVEEFAFDAALFRELRELEKHAAMEVGQYGGTAEVFVGGSGGAGSSGPPTKVTFEWQSSDSSSDTTSFRASGGSTTPGQSSKATADR